MFIRLSSVLCWGGGSIRGSGRSHGEVGGGRREGGGAMSGLGVYGVSGRVGSEWYRSY